MFDPPVITTGIVLGSPKPNIYRVELPNGKRIIGHVPKAMRHLHASLREGTPVTLELTPYDFSKGRISGLVEE